MPTQKSPPNRKPVSARKRRANARNAKKSTGPRTPEGKARSCQNAITHGLLARHVIVLDDPDEDAAEYQEMLDRLLASRQTDDPMEDLLLQRIAAAHWRLARAWRHEAIKIYEARNYKLNPLEQAGYAMIGFMPEKPTIVLPHPPELDKLVRYESMIDLELTRATRQLHQLRTLSAAPQKHPRAAASPNEESARAAAPPIERNCRNAANPPFSPSHVPTFTPNSAPPPRPAPRRKEPTAAQCANKTFIEAYLESLAQSPVPCGPAFPETENPSPLIRPPTSIFSRGAPRPTPPHEHPEPPGAP
jgi:hypothetical protein